MSDLRTELTDAVSGDAPVSEAELTALLQIAEQLQRIELVSDAEAELATTAMWTRVSAELEPRGERAHRAGLVSAPGQAEPAPQFVAPRVRFRRPLMRIGALGAAALMMSATAVAATDTSAGKTVRKAAHAMRLLPQSAVEHGFVGKNRSSATRDRMRNDAKAARTDIRKAADARRNAAADAATGRSASASKAARARRVQLRVRAERIARRRAARRARSAVAGFGTDRPGTDGALPDDGAADDTLWDLSGDGDEPAADEPGGDEPAGEDPAPPADEAPADEPLDPANNWS